MIARDLDDPLGRWRLLLGEPAEPALGGACGRAAAIDGTLEWLYGRDPERSERDVDRPRGAGREAATLTVPAWLEQVHTLFPRETIERLERDAIERYGIDELVTSPEVLDRAEPNETLLHAILRVKHLMNPGLLAKARELVAVIVRRLVEALARDLRIALAGVRDRRRRSLLPRARDLDLARTLRDNLRHYDPARRAVVLARPHFVARTRRHTVRRQLIVVVDQSGSMARSVIHAAVTAACFAGIPSLRTHLLTFATDVVDLTDQLHDPVELLMRVQLGGGTDIDRAMACAERLVDAPRLAMVVLISDLFEGGDRSRLVRRVRALTGQGTTVLVLGALDPEAVPVHDHDMAGRLVEAGAHVAAMTPGHLAAWVAEKLAT